ncbi:MAG: hypothetical protein ACLTSZ_11075 [Lachnospiraceae bacterium]
MSMYENLVMQTQMNYSRYYGGYAAGKTPVRLSDRKPLPYEKQIEKLNEKIKEADCIVVGGASGLSSAGGGDFYYEDTPSFRRYFGKFAEKYGFQGAFAGMGHPYKTRGEFWLIWLPSCIRRRPRLLGNPIWIWTPFCREKISLF